MTKPPLSTLTIPDELKQRQQWVAWKLELRKGKRTKPPYNIRTGTHAKSDNPDTWAPFDECMRAVGNGYDRIGYMLTQEDGIAFIDLDHCRDLKTGAFNNEARRWIERFNTYTEVSVSGDGLHFLARGHIPRSRKNGDYEIYDNTRYFTVTGAHVDGTPYTIEPRQDEVDEFYQEKFPAEGHGREHIMRVFNSKLRTLDADAMCDDNIIKKAEAAKNSDKFKRLFHDGDITDYKSQSEADLALCGMLRFWCGANSTQNDRIFRRSALYRDKWDEQHGAKTYGEMTISEALTGSTETYDFTVDELEDITAGPTERPGGWYCADANSAIVTINGRRKELMLPAIPAMVIVDGPQTIDELLTVFHERLYIEEDYNVTAPVCAFLTNFLPHDPDIYGVVGPSGSIKTEIMRSFGETQNTYCYPISSITEHTFVSGLKDNVDTIPLLRGRAIVIKDLTTLLSKKEDIRSAVFADFREITDGYLHKEFGSGVKKEFHNIHSSILFACTPAIERYYSMYSTLGARMLFIRPQNDPKKAREKARENQRDIKRIRQELQDAMLSFVDANVKRIASEPLPTLPDDIAKEIGEYCDLLAWLRHPLHHDFKGNVDEIPDPEFPTRLNNTITKLTQIHALIFRREAVNGDDLAFARRIVTDNIPTGRAAILKNVSHEWVSTTSLSDKTGSAPATLRYRLEELTALTICERQSRESSTDVELDGRSNHYRISPMWWDTIEDMRGVIRIGGRKEEITSLNSEKGQQLEEIHTTPENVTLHNYKQDGGELEKDLEDFVDSQDG